MSECSKMPLLLRSMIDVCVGSSSLFDQLPSAIGVDLCRLCKSPYLPCAGSQMSCGSKGARQIVESPVSLRWKGKVQTYAGRSVSYVTSWGISRFF